MFGLIQSRGRVGNLTRVPLLRVCALGCLLAAVGHADLLSVRGTTTGAFFGPSGTSYGNPISGLRFTGRTFGPSTSEVNLGSFSLNAPLSIATTYTMDFQLAINFISPVGTAGTVTGSVRGVTMLGMGGLGILFSTTPATFTYSTSQGTGSFNLSLQDVYVSDTNVFGGGNASPLKGTISNATFSGAPEASSVFLITTVFAGTVFCLRKRRT